jgi:hypothetical protein
MGRVKSEQQYTPSNRGASPYSLAYAYDLAGNLTSSTSGNPAAPMTLTNTYDSVGRFLTVTNTTNASQPVPVFSLPATPTIACANSAATSYAAFGGLMNAIFGNALVLNRAYDNRLRSTCEIDTGSVGANATSGSTTVAITGTDQGH